MQSFNDTFQLAIVFFAIVAAIKIILDYSMRKRLIEKGLVDSKVRYLFSATSPAATSLKWGMVLMGIGIAVIIGRLVPYRVQDEITISSMFILAGLALVLYYFIAPKLENSSEHVEQSSSQ